MRPDVQATPDARAKPGAASIAAAFIGACRDELDAPKPGNVHLFAGGHRMSADDFVRSADAAAGPLTKGGQRVGVKTHVGGHLDVRLLTPDVVRHGEGAGGDLGGTRLGAIVEVIERERRGSRKSARVGRVLGLMTADPQGAVVDDEHQECAQHQDRDADLNQDGAPFGRCVPARRIGVGDHDFDLCVIRLRYLWAAGASATAMAMFNPWGSEEAWTAIPAGEAQVDTVNDEGAEMIADSMGGGNRTPNLRFWRPLLCQLSYAPVRQRFQPVGISSQPNRDAGRTKSRPASR